MKDKLKKGQAFIGLDGNKYYFLGFDYDNQVFFTTHELWENQEYITKNNIFIKEILEEKSNIIEHCTWYYQSMDELENASIEEMITRCLNIIENSNTNDIVSIEDIIYDKEKVNLHLNNHMVNQLEESYKELEK